MFPYIRLCVDQFGEPCTRGYRLGALGTPDKPIPGTLWWYASGVGKQGGNPCITLGRPLDYNRDPVIGYIKERAVRLV